MDGLIKLVFSIFQVILWISFVCALMDPGVLGERPPESIYNSIAFIITPLYNLTNWIVSPFVNIAIGLGVFNPQDSSSWFPIATAVELSQLASSFGLSGFVQPTLYPGVLNLWIPLASIAIAILNKIVEAIYDPIRNAVWNLFVEYVFQRKRATMYAQELEKKQEDMTEIAQQYRALAEQTHSLKDSVVTDEMTKIFNKRFFLNRMQQEFDACRYEKELLSLIMVDIDYFKKLNDNYGHLAGDQVLQAVAAVLKRFTPEHCYPCRYGGEEFAVIMPRKDTQQTIEAARLIQENVQLLKFEKIDPKLRVTLSQGICTADFNKLECQNIKHFDEIMELADQQLYRSKIDGRNRVSFHSFEDAYQNRQGEQ